MRIIRTAVAAVVAMVPWFLGLPWWICVCCFYGSVSTGLEFRKKSGDAIQFLLNCLGMTMKVSACYIFCLLCVESMAHQGLMI